jgi:23S rRNA pseudouridine1911/1915/1917 synthase
LIELNIEKQESKLEPYNFALNIVYEDDDLLVLDKPAKISMHPGVGNYNKTLLNAVYFYLGGNLQPQIVHRLDQNTTGLVVIAKNEAIASKLSLQFSERSVDRNYQALVAVTPKAKRAVQINDSGRIETLIGRHTKNRLLMAVNSKAGRNAITNWDRIEKMSYACLLNVKLETGRTHQIRVHMQHLGSPVIGDPDYLGEELLPIELKTIANNFGRQALHAYRLGFDHPTNGKRMLFESKLPEDFQKLISDFRAYGF